MISFNINNGRFNFRIIGVIIDKDRILIHKLKRDEHWSLPGGRGEIGELSENTIIREMKEELDLNAKVKRLLWINENFFTFENSFYHEIGFYYLLNFESNSYIYNIKNNIEFIRKEKIEDEIYIDIIFKWFSIDDLENLDLPLCPSFLVQGLKKLPENITHIIETNTQKK